MSISTQSHNLLQPISPQESIKQTLINQLIKVRTRNNRIFTGRLVSIDFRSNLIMHESVAQINIEHNCELNCRLDNSLDYKLLQMIEKQHPQWTKQETQQFVKSHYYFGAVMISGGDIQQVLLLKK